MKLNKKQKRQRIHNRIRKIVSGTGETPRLCVFRSNKQIYVQAVDDVEGRTLASASSLEKAFRSEGQAGGNVAAAKVVGATIAKRLIDLGIKKAVFDRGGFGYHGRVKALADGAREAGLTI